MNLDSFWRTGALLCAIAFVPAVSQAQIGTCSPAPDRSYTNNSMREAIHLLNDMRYDANRVDYHAQQMGNFAYHPEFAWHTTGIELRRIRARVDDMGKRLCQLERMQNVLPLAEQQAIQGVAPVVQEMADNADAAIRFRNTHHNGLWAPSFTGNAQNLHTEAHVVMRRISRSEQVAG
jgi:hypothetical protein